MKQQTINTYSFNELKEDVKLKVIDKYRYNFVEYNWWDDTLEDAKKVFGIDIKSFDFNRGRSIDIEFKNDIELIAYKILDEWGEEMDLYKDAHNYIKSRDQIIDGAEKDENGEFIDTELLDEKLDELDESFKGDISYFYLDTLEKEHEWLTSDECIIDFIKANEWEFLENGTRF
jgi:hypothetical protein